jgi:hypothetical protein
MLIRIVKFRKTHVAAQLVRSTWNVYSTLVGRCFEMSMWKTDEIGAYCDEGRCHMTDRWPFK